MIEFKAVGLRYMLADMVNLPEMDLEEIAPLIKEAKRRILDGFQRRIAAESRDLDRVCCSGHLHPTFEGRLFCDTMRGYP